VAGRNNCLTRADQAVEAIALDIYRFAAGQPLTEKLVRNRIAELASHPPGCRRCSGLCEAAARAHPLRVLHQVQKWRYSIAVKNIRG
jgi:hypothetical protein